MSSDEMKDWYSKDEINCMNDINLTDEKIRSACSGRSLFAGCVVYNRTGYWKGPRSYLNNKSRQIVSTVWKKLIERNVTLLFPGDSVTKSRTHFLAQDVVRAHPSLHLEQESFEAYENGVPYLLDQVKQTIKNETPTTKISYTGKCFIISS